MIGVLVVTDNIKEWEDKFQACMKFTSKRRDIYSNEFYFANEVFFNIHCKIYKRTSKRS